jgi:hypothetical protein
VAGTAGIHAGDPKEGGRHEEEDPEKIKSLTAA